MRCLYVLTLKKIGFLHVLSLKKTGFSHVLTLKKRLVLIITDIELSPHYRYEASSVLAVGRAEDEVVEEFDAKQRGGGLK